MKIRVVLTVQYEARDEQTDRSGRIRPGRIIARSAGPDPVEVWVDGQWVNSGISLSLPESYECKGTGWWENYSLKPTSSDYAPINWVRFNHLLKLLGAVHGPELLPEEFATLPGKALRSALRKPVVLAYLMGAEGPELDGLGNPGD